MTAGPPSPRDRADRAEPGDQRAEQVLSQALRVMAGGGRRSAEGAGTADGQTPWWDRMATLQLLLTAVLVGLVAGGLVGFASLLL